MEVETILRRNAEQIGLVLNLDYRTMPFFVFDLSQGNEELQNVDFTFGDCC